MGKSRLRVLALFLCFAFVLPLAACKKKEKAEMSPAAKRNRRILGVVMWAMAILMTVLAAYTASHLFCRAFVMTEGSMEPTISAGDTYLINAAAYRFGKPSRGDIVIFRMGDEENMSLHAKRVIGLPGEIIQIVNGQILINGETYMEGGDFPAIIDGGIAQDPVELGPSEYFVLGDNRNGSEDSRYASVGNVRLSDIVGRPWFHLR